MQDMGLVSMDPTAKKDHNQPAASIPKKNILNQNFTAERPNQIWVSDITCYKLKGNHYYIVVILDLFSREVVANRISTIASTKLIAAAFRQAYAERIPDDGLSFHRDRGTQYASQSFQQLLLYCHVEQSFSRTGRPHDNPVAESFFASLKREELYRRNYRSVALFREAVDDYIVFYNTKRPHRTLNYKSPKEGNPPDKSKRFVQKDNPLSIRTEKKIGYMHCFYAFVVSTCKLVRS